MDPCPEDAHRSPPGCPVVQAPHPPTPRSPGPQEAEPPRQAPSRALQREPRAEQRVGALAPAGPRGQQAGSPSPGPGSLRHSPHAWALVRSLRVWLLARSFCPPTGLQVHASNTPSPTRPASARAWPPPRPTRPLPVEQAGRAPAPSGAKDNLWTRTRRCDPEGRPLPQPLVPCSLSSPETEGGRACEACSLCFFREFCLLSCLLACLLCFNDVYLFSA